MILLPSSNLIIEAVADLFDRVVDSKLFIRRINVTANHVLHVDVTNRIKRRRLSRESQKKLLFPSLILDKTITTA